VAVTLAEFAVADFWVTLAAGVCDLALRSESTTTGKAEADSCTY
jgi:hypothetical protein